VRAKGTVDRRFRPGLALLLVGAASTATWLIAAGPAVARGHSARVHSNAAGYGFNAPTSAAVVGSDLFVTNGAGNSVTEVSAVDGAHVATISARRFGFDDPTAIQAVGSNLFVTNGTGNSVTEFSATHLRHVRTIRRTKYKLADPVALASSGPDLFVLNRAGSITEVATKTGALVGVVSGPAFGFDGPSDLVVAGANIFVTNPGADTVTVINAQTRALVAILAGAPYAFDAPTGVAFDGSNVWVTNQNSESVTEISATTLQELNWVQSDNLPMVGPITYGDGYVFTVSPPGDSPMVSQVVPSSGEVTWMMCNTNGPYLFDNPEAAVVAGTNLWVVNEGGNSLTQMDTDSGALIRTVSN
jgi:YVTN family beta-propeller protein